jgi:hypothetical protein
MTTHYVPHRTASGSIRRSWEYVPESRRLVVGIPFGANDLTFAIEICDVFRPIFGHVPIRRIDSETWRVLPERIIRRWPGGVEVLEAMAQSITRKLSFGDSIILTNTPPDVDALLEVL